MYSYKVDRLSGDVLPVLQDAHNHAIDACIEHGQLVATARGDVPVQSIAVGDMVLTRSGYRRVNHAWLSGESEPIWEVKTASTTLRATGNHRVFTVNRGFVRVDALRYDDDLLVQEIKSCQKSNTLKQSATAGADTQSPGIAATESTLSEQIRAVADTTCTVKFGNSTTGQSQESTTSTTRMETAKTTIYRTLSALLQKSTWSIIRQNGMGCESISQVFARSQKNGMQAKKELQSTGRSVRLLTKTLSRWISSASTAENHSRLKNSATSTSIAQTLASLPPVEHQGSITSCASVGSADQRSLPTSTRYQKLVAERVLTVCDTGTRNKVYDLEVDGVHEFVASGVLVHNCRYALEPVMKSRGRGIFG
jgi:hypothetical protein